MYDINSEPFISHILTNITSILCRCGIVNGQSIARVSNVTQFRFSYRIRLFFAVHVALARPKTMGSVQCNSSACHLLNEFSIHRYRYTYSQNKKRRTPVSHVCINYNFMFSSCQSAFVCLNSSRLYGLKCFCFVCQAHRRNDCIAKMKMMLTPSASYFQCWMYSASEQKKMLKIEIKISIRIHHQNQQAASSSRHQYRPFQQAS